MSNCTHYSTITQPKGPSHWAIHSIQYHLWCLQKSSHDSDCVTQSCPDAHQSVRGVIRALALSNMPAARTETAWERRVVADLFVMHSYWQTLCITTMNFSTGAPWKEWGGIEQWSHRSHYGSERGAYGGAFVRTRPIRTDASTQHPSLSVCAIKTFVKTERTGFNIKVTQLFSHSYKGKVFMRFN